MLIYRLCFASREMFENTGQALPRAPVTGAFVTEQFSAYEVGYRDYNCSQ